MRTRYLTWILVAFIAIGCSGKADVQLPAIIGNHMVLQQKMKALLWGKAIPGVSFKIYTSWNKEVYKVEANAEGKWRVYVATGIAGGPYKVVIESDTKISLENVLLGEVWVCSGQSNMEMNLKGYPGQPVNNANEEIATATYKNIRFFTVIKAINTQKQDDCEGEWQECIPETVAQFSATAYFFGKSLHKSINTPVGLILSAWGGTPVESLTSKEGLAKLNLSETGDLDNLDEVFKKRQAWAPTTLFNAMINPLIPYAIKGIIWYQGESNVFYNLDLYDRIFSAMIEDWRAHWGIGNFPFYFTQIAPCVYFQKPEGNKSARLRESQLKTMLTTPNTGMAVTLDIGEKDCIHPAEKQEVGKRLAYWAFAKTYGMKGVEYFGPVYNSMKVEDGSAFLTFDYAENGLFPLNENLEGFEISGEDKKFYPAQAQAINWGEELKVFSFEVKHPVAMRYCWKNWCKGSLFNTAGLPAPSFRTDNW